MADASIADTPVDDTPVATEIVTHAEAKARGLRFFYSGKPCKHGHMAPRYTVSYNCSECMSLQCKARHAADPDKGRARAKAWREEHPDEARAVQKAWREVNRDRKNARTKAWYEAYRKANPGELNAQRKAWKKANPDKVRAGGQAYAKANPDKRREFAAIRRAREIGQLGVVSPGIRAKLRKLQKGKCANCLASLSKAGEHLDHKVPLTLGGRHEDANLELLCQPCNLRKNAKDPIAFANEEGRLL